MSPENSSPENSSPESSSPDTLPPDESAPATAPEDARASRAYAGRSRPEPSPDPDVRKALLATAVRLAGERPLGSIPLEDILRGARVDRATFGLHFADRDDVLATGLVDSLNVALAGVDRSDCHQVFRTIAAWIDRHAALRETVPPSRVGQRLLRHTRGILAQPVDRLVRRRRPHQPLLDRRTQVSLLVGGLTALLWESDPETERSADDCLAALEELLRRPG